MPSPHMTTHATFCNPNFATSGAGRGGLRHVRLPARTNPAVKPPRQLGGTVEAVSEGVDGGYL